MSYDLREVPWLPFRRHSGKVEWGPPHLIVDEITTDPITALASPRPDFDGALTEFLIGLLTVSYRLGDEDDWRELWMEAPTSSSLLAALMRLPPAFDLDGAGPRFLQDFSPADLAGAEIAPVQELLVEGKNDPLFIKPDTLRQIGRPATAMALITIQSYSPAGGRGYRTSLRGGGPLTTLVDPRPADSSSLVDRSLWRYLWANVSTMDELRRGSATAKTFSDPSATFPWMAPTRTSERDHATTVADADPLQCFFGMPRRIAIEFGNAAGRCDLTGRDDDRLVTGFRVKGYGVQYQGWMHPLSPYYAGKQANQMLPVHGQPGGIGWRDWYPLLHSSANGKKVPARTISTFNERRAERVGRLQYSLRAFGFDVTNAKVRSWIDTRLPGFAEPEPDRLQSISALIASLTDATELAAYTLQRVVTEAVYGGSEAPPGDLSFLKASLWGATEAPFYESVFTFLESESAATDSGIRRDFQRILRTNAEQIYDLHVDPGFSQPEAVRRHVVARFDLVMTLSGNGKQGEKLFAALRLSTPKVRRARTATRRATQETES